MNRKKILHLALNLLYNIKDADDLSQLAFEYLSIDMAKNINKISKDEIQNIFNSNFFKNM